MKDYLCNIWLGLLYKLLKVHLKKVDFGVPSFTENFDNPAYIISDRDLYSSDMVTLKENVQVKDGKLLLHTKYENRDFSNWWGTQKKIWSTGYVEYKKDIHQTGIWSVKCRLPDDKDAWPAIWLLRERHPETETKLDLGEAVNQVDRSLSLSAWNDQRVDLNWYIWFNNTPVGFISAMDKSSKTITADRNIPDASGQRIYVSPDHITPEVDIMEIIHGKIQHTIHYGYSNQVYRTMEWNAKRGKPELKKEYEFSVELTRTGYKFYVDRILTAVLTDKKSITTAGAYLILNNAKLNGITSGENSVFEIREVTFYNRS